MDKLYYPSATRSGTWLELSVSGSADSPTVSATRVDDVPHIKRRQQQPFAASIGGRDWSLNAGCFAFVGLTQKGKSTTIIRMTELDERILRVHTLEPFNTPEELAAERFIFFDVDQAVGYALARSLAGYFPVVDSLRDMVYQSSGAQGEKGLNMALFAYLTRLDMAAAVQGLRLGIVANPLVEAEQQSLFETSVNSSVTGMFKIVRRNAATLTYRPLRQDILLNFDRSRSTGPVTGNIDVATRKVAASMDTSRLSTLARAAHDAADTL